ncbi:TFIID and SAGA subunit [Mycena metata]|uniref:TFIID and SAGA subunit n=1 Tax=Mycena metata TaxID=1033252 RepID=A0AAD7P2T5_9AGAR|nr:TFIID and SAGA subunit [Mycena metata]
MSGSSQSPPGGDPVQNATPEEQMMLQYYRSRGYSAAEKGLLEDIEGKESEKGKQPETIPPEDLVKALAVFAQKPSRPGENVFKESANVLQELTAMGNPSNIQNLLASIGSVGAEDILSLDPTDKQEGFRELEAWVDGSLDMYRPEFRPILFPIFCHFYLDLIQRGLKEAAIKFYSSFAPDEKYVVRMSRSGFGLLVGWLTEGVGGEAFGAGDGFTGEMGKRGRVSVMRVVNNHLRFDVTSSNTTSISPNSWEESTGLLSSLIPRSNGGTANLTNPQAFNIMRGDLKLGPAPISDELRAETQRVLREQAVLDREQYDMQRQAIPGVVSPAEADLLPHPPTFRTMDPSLLATADLNSAQGATVRARALPSICAYTLHDVPEGAPCCTFSPDTSLMAAGFSESYVRLWSLNGQKLRGFRSDFTSGSIRDAGSLRKIKEKGGSTTRKLIGHSGPVYSVAFDPVSGSAAPPKYLLSASADATTRLWSMDTLTNLVAFRGHENPIWDVKWSPLGIYFATGSRDRTARLWSTDRISCLRVYAGHLSDVDCVQFHPNSLYLATGSSDWTARLWDVQRGSCVRGAVSSLALSPDGEDLAINLWDLGSGKRIKKMTGHTASIYSLAFSAESSLLVSGGADWTVRCWDVKGAGGTRRKPRENGNASYTPMGLATGEAAAPLNYGDEESMETTDLLATFPTKRTPITNVQFTPRNLCLVGGNYLSPEQR